MGGDVGAGQVPPNPAPPPQLHHPGEREVAGEEVRPRARVGALAEPPSPGTRALADVDCAPGTTQLATAR